MNLKAERMKTDLRRGLSQVFLNRGLSYIMLTDVHISSDYRYARIEIDAINHDLSSVLELLNENPLHKEVIKDLHSFINIKNFPKIKFFPDAHKERIHKTEELFEKIKI